MRAVQARETMLPTAAPLWVPLVGYFGMLGASHTPSGISMRILLPPAAREPRPLSAVSGSWVPQPWVVPSRVVPAAVTVLRFQRWTLPLPGLAAVVAGQVTSMTMWTPRSGPASGVHAPVMVGGAPASAGVPPVPPV